MHQVNRNRRAESRQRNLIPAVSISFLTVSSISTLTAKKTSLLSRERAHNQAIVFYGFITASSSFHIKLSHLIHINIKISTAAAFRTVAFAPADPISICGLRSFALHSSLHRCDRCKRGQRACRDEPFSLKTRSV